MKVSARVSAQVLLHDIVFIEVEDGATDEEIKDAIYQECPYTFDELLEISNGLEPAYSIEYFEKEEYL